MSRNYDNWERLVAATLDREKLRELALASSRETSFSSLTSARFNSPFNFKFGYMSVESCFLRTIQLADHVVWVSDRTNSFKQECSEIKSKAEKIALLLRQAARATPELYERPARRVMGATEIVLKKGISLILKCQGFKRLFTASNSASLWDISSQLEHSIGNIRWLLRDDQYRGVPPIAADEPVLCNIWELIAILHTGSLEDQGNAVASLVSLARESDSYRTIIIEEGGRIEPLLRLLQGGTPETQENAVTFIVLTTREYINYKVFQAFERILEGPLTKLQGTVAWALSELADKFLHDHEMYQMAALLGSLASKTLHEDSKSHLSDESGPSPSRASKTATEMENLATGDYIKEMATRGLWNLAIVNKRCCQIIAESRSLMCFTFFLKKGPKEARYNSVMALVEITAVAEGDTELRKTAFKPNLPAYNAMVDQCLRIIDGSELEILVPCVQIIGNLARTFKNSETRIINLLVRLLNESWEAEVSREACIALLKFAHPNNFLRVEHSKAMVDAGGLKHLVHLVISGNNIVQSLALELLCCIGIMVPRSEKVVEAQVLSALRWASQQAYLMQGHIKSLLPKAVRNVVLNDPEISHDG